MAERGLLKGAGHPLDRGYCWMQSRMWTGVSCEGWVEGGDTTRRRRDTHASRLRCWTWCGIGLGGDDVMGAGFERLVDATCD
jgi:hypothetical protein